MAAVAQSGAASWSCGANMTITGATGAGTVDSGQLIGRSEALFVSVLGPSDP